MKPAISWLSRRDFLPNFFLCQNIKYPGRWMVICWVIVYILKESIFVILSLKKLFKNSSKTLRKSLRQSSSTKVLRPSCEDLWLISKSSFMGLSTLVRYLGGGRETMDSRAEVQRKSHSKLWHISVGETWSFFFQFKIYQNFIFLFFEKCAIFQFFPLQWLKQKLILKTSKVSWQFSFGAFCKRRDRGWGNGWF